jgi:hypothetical protein
MANCGKCGTHLNDNDNFCEKCGSAVHDINSVMNDLKKARNSHEVVSKELTKLREKFNKTETECSELQNEASLKDRDIKNIINRSQQMADDFKKKTDSVNNAKNTIIAAWLITLVLAIGIAWGIYSILKKHYQDLLTQENLLRQEYDRLSENHTNSMQWWPISITDIVVQNFDNTEWVFLSEPGQDIYADQIKYFNVKINFDSRVYGNFDFYVKLWDPLGRLFTTDSSPPDYSFYKYTYNIYRGAGQSKDLDGLPGKFSPGQWTVEIWLNGVCIAARTITLK